MQIYALKYGESVLPQSQIFESGVNKVLMPISFVIYLVKISGHFILIDAGCHTMPGFSMRHFCGPITVLEQMGVQKEQITDVIITHADHDHIEEVSHYVNADVYIQKDEYERGKEYLKGINKVIVFEQEHIICGKIHVQKIGGHSKGSCIAEIIEQGKHYVFAGDECYVQKCLDHKIPTGCSYNPICSKAFIEKYSQPQYRCLLSHDPYILTQGNGWKKII